MALPPGTILGSYEILQQIGAGGMGEVYKANDRRLGRLVAIKILPARLSAQEGFRQRFMREAHVIAGLNHPNICTLYDIGQRDGTEFLVLEFLEGQTLAARLERGPLPLEEALAVAIQIADALDKAHATGITHRDLKPSNIMLTKAGAKLMDFGLAKRQTTHDSSGPTVATGSADLTEHGFILGTVQYMAPEQVEGEEADPRTDIFAFGVVLYEMMTGQKAFSGKSQASLMASIMHQTPATMTTLQPLTPPPLQRVVEICMAKDPAARWQSAHDVLLQLKWISEGGSLAGVPAPVSRHRKSRERYAWITAGLSLASALVIAALYFRAPTVETRVYRFTVSPSPGTQFGPPNQPIRPFPALSPEGKRIVFQAQEPGEPVMLWLHDLDSNEAHPLQGTDGGLLPFWSPDGQNIGFSADRKIKRIPASGGPVQEVCETMPGQTEGTWGKDGTILFGTSSTGIFRVPDAGGMPPVLVTVLSTELKETSHRSPYFLPDGKHFLYLSVSQGPNTIFVGSLDPKEAPKRLLNSDARAIYASPGYVLFIRQGLLMAQRFDTKRLELSGDAISLGPNVISAERNGRAAFAVSDNGILVYREGVTLADTFRIVWIEQDGKRTDSIQQMDDNRSPSLSPDKKHLAVERHPSSWRGCTNCSDLWIIDLESGKNTHFTDGPGDEADAQWSPDGKTIAYLANPDGAFSIYTKDTTGFGKEKLLLKPNMDGEITELTDWSDDGKYLLFTVNSPSGGRDIWYLSVADGKAQPFVQTKAGEGRAKFSHDGHFVAYQSNEGVRPQIYVVPFPSADHQDQISIDGGRNVHWREDMRQLIFDNPVDRFLMAVNISISGTTVKGDVPKKLFPIPNGNARFEMLPDASRFLWSTQRQPSKSDNLPDTPLTVVVNWTATLKH